MVANRKHTEARRSPKGLVGYSRQTGAEADGFRVFKEVGPGKFEIRGTPTLDHVRDLMIFLKAKADEAITLAGKDPARWRDLMHEGDAADRVFWAAKLLTDLAGLQSRLNAMTRRTDLQRAREDGYGAVHMALLVGIDYECLTVVENETPIDSHHGRVMGAHIGGKRKAAKFARRNAKLAQEYRRQLALLPSGSTKTPSKLMEEVGAASEWRLKRSQAIEAIKSGLTISSGQEATPDG